MRKSIKFMTAGIIAAVVVSLGSAAAFAASAGYGSAGALADTDLTVEDMLVYAIQDEYAAQAEYAAIIDTYGSQMPYTNIKRAEDNHISRLAQLFTTYGYTLPVNDAAASVVLPESLEASYATGVTAEENNIAMYEKFLKTTLPEDVKLVFERLLRASNHHLTAFQNAVEGNLTYCQDNTLKENRGNRVNGVNCTGTGTCDGTGTGEGKGNRGGRGNSGCAMANRSN